MEIGKLEIKSVAVLLSPTESFLVEFAEGCKHSASFTLKKYINSETVPSKSLQLIYKDVRGDISVFTDPYETTGNKFRFEEWKNVRKVVLNFEGGGIAIAYRKYSSRHSIYQIVPNVDFHLAQKVKSITVY